MVEMPGFEPGSNVYAWYSYDHESFDSLTSLERNKDGNKSDDAEYHIELRQDSM